MNRPTILFEMLSRRQILTAYKQLLRQVDAQYTNFTQPAAPLWRNHVRDLFRQHRDESDPAALRKHHQDAMDALTMLTARGKHKATKSTRLMPGIVEEILSDH